MPTNLPVQGDYKGSLSKLDNHDRNANIIVAGVGGQGVITITLILANAAMKENLKVIVSEIHGMAQRGGSVISHVRIGSEIYSPTVANGTANMILGLEPSEVLRTLRYINKYTRIVMNIKPVIPPSVSIGLSNYPSLEAIVRECRRFTPFLTEIDALKLATESGSPLAQNMVMIGAAAASETLPLKIEKIKQCISEFTPKKYRKTNLKAFEAGFKATVHIKRK